MQLRNTLFIAFFTVFTIFTWQINAQAPAKYNASEIHAQIEKLNFLGTVLYVAAHPDDEKLTFETRIKMGFDAVKEIVGKVWLYVMIGIAVDPAKE